jgi:uncharacterized protein YgiM (DUF1202 family)
MLRTMRLNVMAIAAALFCLAAPSFAEIIESPAGGEPAGASAEPALPPSAPLAPSTPKRKATAHKKKTAAPEAPVEVEAANARLQLREDSFVYSKPTKLSKAVERVHAPKFVHVTGATKDFVRVELKSGKTGFIPASVVQLVSPADKILVLTADSPVYSKPNRWGEIVAQVHRGHDVQIVGVSLEYVKIRMKSGVEGFIPLTALE